MSEPFEIARHGRGRLLLLLSTVLLAGVLAGYLAMLLAAAGDGISRDDYDAGNRAALLFGFLAATTFACIAGLTTFWLAWTSRRPRRIGFSLAVALSTCAAVVAAVPWLWNR